VNDAADETNRAAASAQTTRGRSRISTDQTLPDRVGWHDERMDSAAALTRWHAVVDSRDPAGLPGLIAEDAIFRSPAVHTPQEGRDTVVGYLTAAFTVLGPALTYEREWLGDDSAVLQFRTEVGGLDVSGIDMITWDDDGQIVDFTVMVRPAKALQVVIEHMGAELLRMLEAAGR
jgi:hypothetical protein